MRQQLGQPPQAIFSIAGIRLTQLIFFELGMCLTVLPPARAAGASNQDWQTARPSALRYGAETERLSQRMLSQLRSFSVPSNSFA